MKKISFLLLLIICLGFIKINSITAQEPNTTNFRLQTGKNSSLTVLHVNTPINVILEVNVTKQNSQTKVVYYVPYGTVGITAKTINLTQNKLYSFSLNTSIIMIQLDYSNSEYINFTSSGFYRIHENGYDNSNPWESFNLLSASPAFTSIFPSNGWIDKLTITVNLKELVNGSLALDYTVSDAGSSETMEKTGIFTYSLNASSLTLFLDPNSNYSRATGTVTITDLGHISRDSWLDGFNSIIAIFSVGLLGLILIKYRSKKYE